MTDQTARAEAERRWPITESDRINNPTYTSRMTDVRIGFERGAAWARAQVLAEVREEVRKTLDRRKVKPFDGLAVLAVLDQAAGKTGARDE